MMLYKYAMNAYFRVSDQDVPKTCGDPPISGSVQGQARRGLEQPGLAKGVRALGLGVERDEL